MKTVFVLLDSGFPIRNLLRNPFWQNLTRCEDLKIILFSPVVDPYFLEEFGAANVEIRKTLKWKPNFVLRLLRSTKRIIWSIAANSRSFDLKLTLKKGLAYRIFSAAARQIPKRTWIASYRFISRIERGFVPRQARQILDEFKPDLVFLTTIFARNLSVELEAHNQGIRTLAFVQSWDNPTTKGPMPFLPDTVAVWNETIKEEMVEFHDIERDRIKIVGVPQFDHYRDEEHIQTLEDFKQENGIGAECKILCYTTGTPWTSPYEKDLVELIYSCVAEDAFAFPCHLVVRPHPNDDRDYSRFRGLPGFAFHSLGNIRNSLDNWGPSKQDMYRFAALMKHSDVVVNVASTTTIDAAFFDTPVVNIAFDGATNREYIKSNRRYYEYCHYENIVKTDGVSICYDREDFIKAVDEALLHPERHAAGRKRIIREQCWQTDGSAGERLAALLLEETEKATSH